MAEAETTLAGVLAEHTRGDWSDRTYSCQGCANRFENGSSKSVLDYTSDELREWRVAYNRVSHPGWSLIEYYDHVEAALLDHLAAKASEAAVVEVVDGALAAVHESYIPDDLPSEFHPYSTAAVAAFLEVLR